MPAPDTPGIMNTMPSHEEGEFELVLGNKQLLSVFFLVILLLGVFFSMGYIVGRNTAPATSLSASSRQPPIVVDPVGGGSSSLPVRPPAADSYKPSPLATDPPKPMPMTKADPPKATEPVKTEPPKVEPPKLVPMVKADPPKVVEPPKPKPEPVKPPKVDPPKVTAVVTKGGGTFLQVMATKQPEASQVVAALSAKGFPASLSPVPDSTLLRVIVGPLGDAASVSKTRDGLQAAGYKPFIRKF